jgi:hypothetical protein
LLGVQPVDRHMVGKIHRLDDTRDGVSVAHQQPELLGDAAFPQGCKGSAKVVRDQRVSAEQPGDLLEAGASVSTRHGHKAQRTGQ